MWPNFTWSQVGGGDKRRLVSSTKFLDALIKTF